MVRNSWGSGWGAGGYGLFQRGVNLCGIEVYPAAYSVSNLGGKFPIAIKCELLIIEWISAFNWQDDNNGQVTWAMDCDFSAPDIGNETTSTGDTCGLACINNSQCKYFTWDGQKCSFKSTVNPSVKDSPGSICGWVNSRVWLQVNLVLYFSFIYWPSVHLSLILV